MKIPFATRSYRLDSLPVSAQRLVNSYAEQQPADTASPIVCMPTPGIKSWSTVGSGKIRGQGELNGVLYVVSGTELYSVNSAGTETLIGTVAGSDHVYMASNGTELFIATGGTGYIYDTTGGLQTIVSAGYPSGDFAVFIDGYFLTNNPGTGQVYYSNLYDGTTWDALDFFTAEGSPDNLVSMIANERELILLGDKTTETWLNTAASTVFSRQIVKQTGCGAKHSVAEKNANIFWLGDDLQVYRAESYQPIPISDYGVAQAIAGYSTTSDAYGWVHVWKGHTFYTLTFPTEGETWTYDLRTNAWHERETYDEDHYRAFNYIFIYGKHLIGDYSAGVVYELDADTYDDAGSTLRRIATSPPVSRETWGALQIEFEHGVGLTTGQGSDPVVALRWSDDGKTWSNSHTRKTGKIGEYKSRAIWRRMGQPRRRILNKPAWRIFEITMTDPIKWVIVGAYAD